MSIKISVRRGSIYLSAEAVNTYFPGLEAVIVIIRDGELCVLPVQHVSAGGCLLKIRNSSGDCVAAALDVFAANGLEEWVQDDLEAAWDSSKAALVCSLPTQR